MSAAWFDLDGTLLRYDRSFAAVFEAVRADVGVAPTEFETLVGELQ